MAIGARAASRRRVTLSFVAPDGPTATHTFEAARAGVEPADCTASTRRRPRASTCAPRDFELERLWAPEDMYCFYGARPRRTGDERLFVLGDVRARPAADSHTCRTVSAIFERAFQAGRAVAAREPAAPRSAAPAAVEPARRCSSAQPVVLDAVTRAAPRATPRTRDTPPRPREDGRAPALLDRGAPDSRAREIGGRRDRDLAGSRLELDAGARRAGSRSCRPRPTSASRRGAAARSRLSVRDRAHADERQRRRERTRADAAAFPAGRFEEYDLDPAAPDAARGQRRRPRARAQRRARSCSAS